MSSQDYQEYQDYIQSIVDRYPADPYCVKKDINTLTGYARKSIPPIYLLIDKQVDKQVDKQIDKEDMQIDDMQTDIECTNITRVRNERILKIINTTQHKGIQRYLKSLYKTSRIDE
jgi:hypothetical protein